MLFVLFVFIYSCFRGVIITDITTFCDCVCSVEPVTLLVAISVIIMIYALSFFKIHERKESEDIESTSRFITIPYGVIGVIVFFVTASKSLQLCNTIMWWYVVLWTLVTSVITIIIGRKKKVSYLDSILSFFYLEECMICCVAYAIFIVLNILSVVAYAYIYLVMIALIPMLMLMILFL